MLRRLVVIVGLVTVTGATGDLVGSPQEPPRPWIEIVRDIAYASGPSHEDGRGLLVIYLPAEPENAPVLIFMHGGGLGNGDKRRVRHIGRRFASEGFVTVYSNYRLTPPNRHPAHIEDAAAAFNWVYRNIDEYGGDPDSIFVSGGSAGGYLAALLAYDGSYLAEYGLGACRQ